MHQFRQHVIMTLVLLGCAAIVFFGIRQMVSDPYSDEGRFAVAEWSTVDVPLYEGPATYRAASSQGRTMALPMVSSKSHSLFHHNAVVSYSGEGGVTNRASFVHPSYQPVYQTSNSTVHSIGGGGASGGGYSESAGRGTSTIAVSGGSNGYSARSIGYSSANSGSTYAYATPSYGQITRTYALNSSVGAMATEKWSSAPGRRRITDNGDGTYTGDYDGETNPDGTKIWSDEAEGWIDPPANGTTKEINGELYVWTVTSPGHGYWRPQSDISDPDAPIGDMPWILLILMMTGYAVFRRMKTKKITIKK